MTRKDIDVEGLKRHEVNPFLKDMGIVFRTNSGTSQMYGEDGVPFSVIKKVWTVKDTYKFTRLYGKGVMNLWPRAMRWDLKTTRMFLWLMQNMRKGQDLIEIDPFLVMGELNLTKRKEVEQAVRALVDDGVLAVHIDAVNHFWINPSLFYSGDRTELVMDGKKINLKIFENFHLC